MESPARKTKSWAGSRSNEKPSSSRPRCKHQGFVGPLLVILCTCSLTVTPPAPPFPHPMTSKEKYDSKRKAAVDNDEDEKFPMPLKHAEATEDKLAVGTIFPGGKQEAQSVSAAVMDKLSRRMRTTTSNPTEIDQKCVTKGCTARVHVTLKLKQGVQTSLGATLPA